MNTDSILIAKEVKTDQNKAEMLQRALERIIQLYTDRAHFIYELLQNAEDAGAHIIEFLQYEDRLEVLHDGRPFSNQDVKGLCDIGQSNKANDLNQIGEFGVGFKSVFGICDTVRLYSHPKRTGYAKFALEIQGFVNPEPIEDVIFNVNYTTKFVFPYKVGLSFSSFKDIDVLKSVISDRLQNLGVSTLLFMRNLQTIKYSIFDSKGLKISGNYSLIRWRINNYCVEVTALEDSEKNKTGEQTSYLVFSRPTHNIGSNKTIDIAFSRIKDKKGNYSFVESKSPYISVYFPTETESKLKFIVQGPYRTTPNRSSVPADNAENIELAKQTAVLFKDSVISLKNMGMLDLSFFNVLTLNVESFASFPLFRCMYNTIIDVIRNENVLPCKENGIYTRAKFAKIARGEILTEVFTDNLLSELINNQGIKYHWLPTCLTETNSEYKELYYFLTSVLKIDVIRPENTMAFFSNNRFFLQRRDDDWLVKLYNMYGNLSGSFTLERKNGIMLTSRFVKTIDGKFVSPYKEDYGQNSDSPYVPNVFIQEDGRISNNDVYFVNTDIYDKCKHFFKDILRLTTLDSSTIFVSEFKNKYCNSDSFANVTKEEYRDDIMFVLEDLDYYHFNEVKEFIFIKCLAFNGSLYLCPFKKDLFIPKTKEGLDLKSFYENIDDSKIFVDLDFYNSIGINEEKLKHLNVKSDFFEGDRKGGIYETDNPGKQPSWSAASGSEIWRDFKLKGLTSALGYIKFNPQNQNSKEKSRFIFQFLQQYEKHLSGKIEIGSPSYWNHRVIDDKADIVKLLCNRQQRWLFSSTGKLVSPSEISKYDLDTTLYGEVRKGSKIYEILGFKEDSKDKEKKVVDAYKQLSPEDKNIYLRLALEEYLGRPFELDELKQIIDSSKQQASSSVAQQYASNFTFSNVLKEDFPSAKVKNWDSLRKHAREVFCFARPIAYQRIIRQIRTSKNFAEPRTYLKNMYKSELGERYACQMCHQFTDKIQACEISKKGNDSNGELELDAMYLCLCPNCAAKYKEIRGRRLVTPLGLKIRDLKEDIIKSSNPVKIAFEEESIWFTQSHIAEIRELILLQNEMKKNET